jgi:hypothetical protein
VSSEGSFGEPRCGETPHVRFGKRDGRDGPEDKGRLKAIHTRSRPTFTGDFIHYRQRRVDSFGVSLTRCGLFFCRAALTLVGSGSPTKLPPGSYRLRLRDADGGNTCTVERGPGMTRTSAPTAFELKSPVKGNAWALKRLLKRSLAPVPIDQKSLRVRHFVSRTSGSWIADV